MKTSRIPSDIDKYRGVYSPRRGALYPKSIENEPKKIKLFGFFLILMFVLYCIGSLYLIFVYDFIEIVLILPVGYLCIYFSWWGEKLMRHGNFEM